MRLSILFKTLLTLLISFSLLFFLGLFWFYRSFSSLYVEKNIEAVKESIINSIPFIESGSSLDETALDDFSSETTFIRVIDNVIIERIGPENLSDSEIIQLVIGIYDSDETIVEENLIYHVELVEDIYQVNYIYKFSNSDFMLIRTRIQSLTNVDIVMTELGQQSIAFLIITIALLSVLISYNIARPIKKINKYAKKISALDFSSTLRLNRKDEFQELITSLNEMTYNLKKSYAELNEANMKLSKDIDFEKNQENKKKALIMTINHELKTPVAVIKGMVEGMLDGVGRYKNKEKYLKEVLEQLDSIELITKDLTYSLKLEDLAKQNDHCNTSILKEKMSSLEEFGKQLKVKVHSNILPCEISFSEELFIILASNLIKNAITYTADNSISIDTSLENHIWTLVVRNKGEIPYEDLERIFEPYYRVNQIASNPKGTGLGLFIVKQICEIYGCGYKLFNDNGYVVAKVEIKERID